MEIKSDEKIIELAKQIWAQNKYPTRNDFKKVIGAGQKRLEDLHKAGLIVYPNKTPKNMCRVFKKNDKWAKFRLRGSPTFKETEHGKL